MQKQGGRVNCRCEVKSSPEQNCPEVDLFLKQHILGYDRARLSEFYDSLLKKSPTKASEKNQLAIYNHLKALGQQKNQYLSSEETSKRLRRVLQAYESCEEVYFEGAVPLGAVLLYHGDEPSSFTMLRHLQQRLGLSKIDQPTGLRLRYADFYNYLQRNGSAAIRTVKKGRKEAELKDFVGKHFRKCLLGLVPLKLSGLVLRTLCSQEWRFVYTLAQLLLQSNPDLLSNFKKQKENVLWLILIEQTLQQCNGL